MCSAARAIIEGCTLCREVISEPPEVLPKLPNLGYALIMLALSSGVGSVLGGLDSCQSLTELPRQLIEVLPEIRTVVVFHLRPGGLVAFVEQLPGGYEEVDRLARETDCMPKNAPIGKLRAFKIRLEGALVRLTIQQQEQERRQE